MACSQSSCASTIPYEFLSYNDIDFNEELEVVNSLYFGNVQNPDSDNDSPVVSDTEDDSSVDDSSETDICHDVCLDSEDIKQRDFQTDGCGCKRYHGVACSSVVNWKDLLSYRLSCLEKIKEELDMIVKFQLFNQRNSSPLTVGNKRKRREREKPRQTYYIAGTTVCRNVFAFAHGINRKTVDRIARSLDQEGLNSRVHGNSNKKTKHSLSLDDVAYVKNVLINYGSQNGLPLPGRTPNYNEKYILLPSDKNKSDIYYLYFNAADKENKRKVSASTFRRIWLDQCPYLLVMKPATDLCLKCQKHVHILSQSGNLEEEEKAEKIQNYQEHISKVKCQRDHYRYQCEITKYLFDLLPEERKIRGQRSGEYDIKLHYSFDFAQQVFYPHQAQQVGPLYFKTPRKCTQIFYLIDEKFHTVGKGANCVTSLLHHHFEHLGFGERHAVMHMDNCSGQNKNNTVIGYGLWRTMTGRHETIEFSMMEAGHTKFSPDWHFGLWKVRWRHSNVNSLEDIVGTVQMSSRNGHNIPHLVEDKDKPVLFYNWSKFMREFFKPIPKLLSYHHFRMTSARPGSIFVKQYAEDEEVKISVLKKDAILPDRLPDLLPLPGLDPERLWYLYEEIGPLCFQSESACPKPKVPKPTSKSLKVSKVEKC